MDNSKNFISLKEALEELVHFFMGDIYSIDQYMKDDNNTVHRIVVDHIKDIYNDTVEITCKICRISLITNVVLGIACLISGLILAFD